MIAPMLRTLIIAAGLALVASVAHADPCKFIPDAGPMPAATRPGNIITGPVVYVGDGDSICVSIGQGPRSWVEIRIADFYAPELREPGGEQAKAAMTRIAMGRTVRCATGRRTYDRVVATCTLNGTSLGSLMRRAGVREGGRGRR